MVLLAGGKDGRVTSASAVASAARIHYRPPVSHVSKAPRVSDLVYERMNLIVAVFATQWAAGRVNPGKARFGRGLPRLPPRRRRCLSRFHAAECRKRRLSNLFRSGPQARLRCARSNARRSGIHGARHEALGKSYQPGRRRRPRRGAAPEPGPGPRPRPFSPNCCAMRRRFRGRPACRSLTCGGPNASGWFARWAGAFRAS